MNNAFLGWEMKSGKKEESGSEEQSLLMDQLDDLKTRIISIHGDVPCFKESEGLSNLLHC